MKLLLQHKILLSYFMIVAVVVSMIAILLHERNLILNMNHQIEYLWDIHEDVHKAHSHIIELALQGESAAGWNDEERDEYHTHRTKTDSILSMLGTSNRTFVPKEEINTVRRLLKEKEAILTAIMEIQRQRKLADQQLVKGLPDAVKQATRIRQVTIKKTGIAGWLGGKKTIQVAPNTDKLQELNKRMVALHEKQTDSIGLQTDSLMEKNEELNRRLIGLVDRLDSIAETTFLRHGKELDMIRIRSFRTLASMSGVAIMLLVLSFGIIRRDIHRNIRKKKEKEQLIAELQEASRKNEELMKARQNIIQTVAHELRTPLTAIGGNAELIKHNRNSKDTVRRAETIRQSSGQMATLVDSLLNYSRIDSGKETVRPKPFPLRSIAEMLEADFILQIDAKGLRLVVENHADEVVEGDKGLILRIGTNLLSNAVKFTEQGIIELVTDYKNSMFTLTVKDTGSGISKENKERIFIPFERLSNAATQDGFGLGLAIVDNLVRMMDGSISVESECGKGSLFTVTLPMKRAEISSADILEGVTRHKHLSGYSVIVIEDNDVLLGLIKDIFVSNGIRCEICHNVGELTEKMRIKDYDLVITDLKMPEINGYEILELLRLSDIGNSRTVPVSVVTASGSVTEKELLDAGFTACLFKPYSVEDLLTMSETAIGAHDSYKDSHVEMPDFSQLLGFGDVESTLDRIITETEEDMEKLKAAANSGDTATMSGLVHKMRSSWILMGVEGVLRNFHETLHKEHPTKAEHLEAVERVLEQGKVIIRAAKEQKGVKA